MPKSLGKLYHYLGKQMAVSIGIKGF